MTLQALAVARREDLMIRRNRHLLSLAASLIALGLLIWLALRVPPSLISWAGWALFAVLALFTMTFGVPLGAGEVSLLPMTIVAAALSIGPVAAAWVAYIAALVHGLVRQRWADELGARREPNLLSLVAISTANATMHSLGVLVAGQAYLWVGGTLPLAVVRVELLPVVVLCVVYLAANFALAGLYILSLERASIGVYLRSIPNVLQFEATPLLFAPQTALIYTRLGLGQFALFSTGLMAISLILRRLAESRRHLERRVRELDSLQAVGHVLSTSLDLETVLEAVYNQVAALMPARNYYMALYDAESETVSFPMVIEDGVRLHPRPRSAGNGLTEHILRTQAPLLVQQDVPDRLRELGVAGFGPPAACWLGVPILAGSESLGVIAVQSYDVAGVYDANHERVLVTIAAQAAAAIQNARLYERTDEALARRVQELDSILRTTQEGILLLDIEWRILAANPWLAVLLEETESGLIGQSLRGHEAGVDHLLQRLGYAAGELQDECSLLIEEGGAHQKTLALGGAVERYVERTLAPVLDRNGTITSWLIVLRDITEQTELNRFRDDMMHMLVHDLRSPLAVLRGSLELMENDLMKGNVEGSRRWLGAAQSGSDRLLRLIDQLLDISKLESGRMTTETQLVEVAALFEETAQRFASLAREIDVRLQIVTEPALPRLQVDPALMGRVFGNLVDNALKFTDNGGVIRLWARKDPENGGVLLGVSDTGPGIPPEAQPLLFQKFQQVPTTKGRRRGTGLGLPFCKLAVEAHGGRIWVVSPSDEIETVDPGHGSTFVIQLSEKPPAEKAPAVGSEQALHAARSAVST
jgi:NtrC-family two-component system sensor histidine kinase KinB